MAKNFYFVSLSFFTFISFFIFKANAYVGATSTATAEAGRASVESSDALFLNPAALAHVKGYIFSTGYSASSDASQDRGQDFMLSISDNLRETVVPTALSFLQSKPDPYSEAEVTRDFRLSVGNFYDRNLALGLGARYKDDQLPLNRYSQVNLNFGALYSLTDTWGFGFVLENFLGASDKAPRSIRLRPSTAAGVSYIYRRFLRTRLDLISADNNSFDQPTVATGLESYMNRWLIMRIGFQRQSSTNSNLYSAGLGFAGPRIAVQYAYLTSPEQNALTRHTVDMSLPIW